MIKLNAITKSFGDDELFNSFSIEFEAGKTTVIMGPSGCGKTTLLRIAAGIDKQFYGSVINSYNKISFCFQDTRLLPWESVLGNIQFISPNVQYSKIERILRDLSINHLVNNKCSTLSGGEAQRVSLARALLFSAPLFLADEPLNSLDYSLKQNALDLLTAELEVNKRTSIYVTHDPFEAVRVSDSIILLSGKPVKIHTILDNRKKTITPEELYYLLAESKSST
jgi:NitT/TauT family transport system ATP-binding protein